MAEYIDVEKLIKSIKETLAEFECFKSTFVYKSYEEFMKLLQEVPTADVVEVKRGHWIEHLENNYWHYDCPFCNDGYATKGKDKTPPNYCSNCGADMRGDEK